VNVRTRDLYGDSLRLDSVGNTSERRQTAGLSIVPLRFAYDQSQIEGLDGIASDMSLCRLSRTREANERRKRANERW